jgi:hypothetical protein
LKIALTIIFRDVAEVSRPSATGRAVQVMSVTFPYNDVIRLPQWLDRSAASRNL